jgi:hypothetical protein
MYEHVANAFVIVLYLYGIVGLLFALPFVMVGVKRVDSQAIGSSVGFRFLVFPGSVAFWPFLLRSWIISNGEPPEERNPHR